jgi:hypothetical protein
MTGLVDFEFFHQMLVKQCCQTVVGHSIAQHTVFGQCHGLVNEDRLEMTQESSGLTFNEIKLG